MEDTLNSSGGAAPRKTSPLLIAVAWLVVGIPAVWGVSQTFMKSLALFQGTPPASTVAK